jgi:acetylornithine deacetylase/succinyl-diaminopimelate desuccinylase-like protein
MVRFLEAAADALPAEAARTLRGIAAGELEPSEIDRAIDGLCDPMYARALRALIRDTLSPNVVEAGVKYNVIPGDARIDVDCRILPGTSEADIREEVEARIGREVLGACGIERLAFGAGRGTVLGHARRDAA